MVSLSSVRTNRFFRHVMSLNLSQKAIFTSVVTPKIVFGSNLQWVSSSSTLLIYSFHLQVGSLWYVFTHANNSTYPEGHVSALDTTTSALSKWSIVELASTLYWQSRCSIASVRKRLQLANVATHSSPSVCTIIWLTSLCLRLDLWMPQRKSPFKPYFILTFLAFVELSV